MATGSTPLSGMYSHVNRPRMRNTSVLARWLRAHESSPYPTKTEKQLLSYHAGMTMTQVSTWFANARRRIKKIGLKNWLEGRQGLSDDEPSPIWPNPYPIHNSFFSYPMSADISRASYPPNAAEFYVQHSLQPVSTPNPGTIAHMPATHNSFGISSDHLAFRRVPTYPAAAGVQMSYESLPNIQVHQVTDLPPAIRNTSYTPNIARPAMPPMMTHPINPVSMPNQALSIAQHQPVYLVRNHLNKESRPDLLSTGSENASQIQPQPQQLNIMTTELQSPTHHNINSRDTDATDH